MLPVVSCPKANEQVVRTNSDEKKRPGGIELMHARTPSLDADADLSTEECSFDRCKLPPESEQEVQ